MTLPRLHNVPHVGVAQIDTDDASVCVVLPDDASACDLVISASDPRGRTMASATLGRAHAIELRDALTDAIETMPGELGD